MNKGPSIKELNQMLVNIGVESVVAHLVGNGNYQKNAHTLGMSSYQGGKTGASFQITTNGANAGIWHENNPSERPNPEGRGDLVELWALTKGLSKGDALKEIRDFLGESPSRPRPNLTVVEKPANVPQLSENKPVSLSTVDKYQRVLNNKPEALNWLYSRGLNNATIQHFGLGLSTPYEDRNKGLTRCNALVFPPIGRGGYTKPFAYYNIPGITQNPIDENGWCKGAPRLCFNVVPTNKHQFLFIAEGFKDLWMLHQVIVGTALEEQLLIATSTHGSRIPEEVKNNPALFHTYEKVFLGQDGDPAGDDIAFEWLSHIGPRAYRVTPPIPKVDGKDWTDYFRDGTRNVKHLAEILAQAEILNSRDLVTKTLNYEDAKIGQFFTLPELDARSAYYNGYMYYAVEIVEVGLDSNGGKGMNATTKIIRSDRQMLNVIPVNRSVNYTTNQRQFHRLSDGTMLKCVPTVSASATWKWEDVYAWLNGDFKPRRLGTIVDSMVSAMKSRVWLPNEDDYTVLSLVMVTTYVQQIFDAVPFLLATGPAGSGKTELGRVLSLLGCNAVVTGDISSKTITRLIDQTKGFLIIDDAEKLSRSGKGGNGDIDDLLQILKVSYKKSSATRQVTDNKTMQVSELDFYGVKLFTNTKGMEDILATRTIPIHTRKPQNGFKQAELPVDVLRGLRAELHAWAMENASWVHDIYKTFAVSNRDDEITTPLRVFAQMENRTDWAELTDRLISRMSADRQAESSDSPEGYVREAVMNIARRGYLSVTMEHVLMEMEMLVPEHFGKEFTTDIPEWKHAGWAKRTLYGLGYINDKSGKRVRVAGREVPMQRLYDLSPGLFAEIEKIAPAAYQDMISKERIHGNDYCRQHIKCHQCPYENISCDIRNKTNKR